MKYYLDTEFDTYAGLLSLALVAEDGRELYVTVESGAVSFVSPWVGMNVLPLLFAEGAQPQVIGEDQWHLAIDDFLVGDQCPHIIADWPEDITWFCKKIITGPGEMIAVPGLQFSVVRVDSYPTSLHGAVQHNALWDARALQAKLLGR